MSAHAPIRPPHRILVIEDNADGRESMRLLLSLMGKRVEVAADGAEGVRKALASHPDAALVDIGLPKLDGFQVARRLRAALGDDITLIAYTTYAEDVVGSREMTGDFDGWVVKPAALEQLAPWLGTKSEPAASATD